MTEDSAGPWITQDWVVGLTRGEAPTPQAPRAQVLHELETASAADPADLDLLKKLAEVYRQDGQFDAAMRAWERVLAVNPTYRRGLSRLVSVGARGCMDWPRIWSAVRHLEPLKKGSSPYRNPALRAQLDALFSHPHAHPERRAISAEEAEAVVAGLEDMAQGGRQLKPTTLTLVLMRLQFDGHFRAGFRLRELGARRRIAEALTKPVTPEVRAVRDLLKALTYVGQPAAAAEFAGMQRWAKDEPRVQQRLNKMQADALLAAGKPDRYVAYSAGVRDDFTLPGEEHMRALVEGKRIAVVGPADTGDELGSVIDDYDVVVRPRYQPDFLAQHTASMGSRTDIAYYSGFDMGDFLHTAAEAVARGELQLVNARPFTYASHHHLGHAWLRFYRHDYSLCPAGGQLGVQRMIYDILQFSPLEITIFNSDFYTGSQMFTPGWRPQDRFAPGSHINDIVAAHDIRFDFQFTQALIRSGKVTARGRAAAVLQLNMEQYLDAVEAARVLR
ncbi:tetratricopeptide repeat protein [Nesterenkonia flava]|uniref:Tetratricopeptide repeat protein n=1 Tax=Nesterenkonia flava TaxID=469799 RepID=A0ABU1FR71_9MICC|nr:hypothetical protein [Nesterenkonia flava]MDR5710767.1 hypothetical protein [Nesterenkonia flava]